MLEAIRLNYLYGWGVRGYYYVRRGCRRANEERVRHIGWSEGYADGRHSGIEEGKRLMDPDRLRDRLSLLEEIVRDFERRYPLR